MIVYNEPRIPRLGRLEGRWPAQRLHFMAEVSRLLSWSHDYEQNLSRLAQLSVPQLADFCAIDLLRPDGTIERIAVAAGKQVPPGLSIAAKGYTVDARQPYGSPAVIRSGRTEYYPDLTQQLPSQVDDEDHAFVDSTGLVSWICVPLLARDGPLGVISVGRSEAAPRFTEEDVAFVEELARRASLAVDNALLYHEARDTIHSRDAFISIAAHELKTPLTALLGYLELVQRRVIPNAHVEDRDRRLLGMVIDQARRLNKIIQALFDLSRLQIGHLTIELVALEICGLVSRITKEIEPTVDRHSLYIQIDDQPLVIRGDELRLEQVIQNLIHNAIKYSPLGGPVFVRVERQNQWARISVRDQGIGIPDEALTTIFQWFYRAANTERHRISGMGVGLYVGREIIDLHGGRIEVESVEGQGSTVCVWLPLPVDEGAGSGANDHASTTTSRSGGAAS